MPFVAALCYVLRRYKFYQGNIRMKLILSLLGVVLLIVAAIYFVMRPINCRATTPA
jgi:flagellar biogenesis protein FliO